MSGLFLEPGARKNCLTFLFAKKKTSSWAKNKLGFTVHLYPK